MQYGRAKVNLRLELGLGGSILSWNYRHGLYSVLLDAIGAFDREMARKIHEGELPRAFVFSNLIPSPKDAVRIKKNASPEGMPAPFRAHFYITSREGSIFRNLIGGLTNMSKLWLAGKDKKVIYHVEQVVVERIEVNSNDFSLLSPLVVRDKAGKYLDIDVVGRESIEETVNKGLERVADAVGVELDGGVKIIGELKKKLYYIHDTPVLAYIPKEKKVLKIDGELTKAAALYLGLGDKTHLGFGMVGL